MAFNLAFMDERKAKDFKFGGKSNRMKSADLV